MACPVCETRAGNRFCPPKGERICALCCGREREVTIDCPFDCPYLEQARRYDAERRQPLPPEQMPFADDTISEELIHHRQDVVAALGYAALGVAREHASLADEDLLSALRALAETYRTLNSGIIYERPPVAPLAQQLYEAMAKLLEGLKPGAVESKGMPALKNREAFEVLLFLLRVGASRTNGRPRSRAFLDFLRASLPPAPETQRQAPRIIVP